MKSMESYSAGTEKGTAMAISNGSQVTISNNSRIIIGAMVDIV